MKPKLTVIIPFLNEGEEVERTVRSIRETAGAQVAILLINDASQDATDYEAVAGRYGTAYHCNNVRKGVAVSRDWGVAQIDTDYFLIVDAHMRFYFDNWWNRITEELQHDERALYCTVCKVLDENGEPVPDRDSVGACLTWCEEERKRVLTPEWNMIDLSPGEATMEIPCVLGACYAASKKYWTYLKGLQGLERYGSDEAYISLKVWLEGGRCVLIKDVGIGHIFRTSFPYEVKNVDLIYNKLLIMETVMPSNESTPLYNLMRRTDNLLLRDAMEKLQDNRVLVNALKDYYNTIFTRDISAFKTLNERFVQLNRRPV